MNAAAQYKSLLDKVASRSSPEQVEAVYNFCMSKSASLGDKLLWASVGGLPAYLLGSSMAREDESRKHKNYALAGLAAGVITPKLISALADPAAAFPSVSGFDAADIKNLQLESLD